MRSTRNKLSGVILCIGVAAACTHGPTDAAILSAIDARVLREPSLGSYSLRVESRGGAVTLTGTVGTNDAKAALESLVRRTDGVKSLTSNVIAPPVSPPHVDDSALANEIKSRIFSDTLLSKQAIQVASSGGVVTLSGTVANDLQRIQAEQVAAQVNGATKVSNELKVAAGTANFPPKPPKAPKPTVTLIADPSMVAKGKPTKLKWGSNNAASLDLEPGIGAVDANGDRDVIPPESMDYILTANGPGGSAIAKAHVDVWDPCGDPDSRPTATLAAASGTVQRGQSTTLIWNSQNATSLDIQPQVGKVGPNGSASVAPQQITDYLLTVTGPCGTTTATARVSVQGLAPPSTLTVPAGTTMAVRLDTSVDTSSKDIAVGQPLTASVASPVRVNGREVIPAGAPAHVILEDFKKAGRLPPTRSEVTLRLVGFTVDGKELPVDCAPYRQEGPPHPPVIVIDTKPLQVRIQPGVPISFRLTAPIVVRVNP